jgi:hypothetical protein
MLTGSVRKGSALGQCVFWGPGHIGYASGSDNARETDDAIETDNARKSGNAKAPGSIPRGLLVRRFRLRLRTEL